MGAMTMSIGLESDRVLSASKGQRKESARLAIESLSLSSLRTRRRLCGRNTVPRSRMHGDWTEAMTKRKSKGAYMISAVAEMYDIHPQTLRLYEREGLLKPAAPGQHAALYRRRFAAAGVHPVAGARSRRQHQRDGNHSANARAHGRDAAPDSGVRAVHPKGSSGAGNGGS